MNDFHSQEPLPIDPAGQSARGKSLFTWRRFWLTFLVVSLGYAWYCFYVPANSIAWADSFDSAQQRAAQSGKPTILFFTGKWCVPCRIMKRNVWADQQVTAAVNARFIAVMIDTADPEATEALARYRIGSTPTTIITDQRGEILQQVEGGIGKSEFLECRCPIEMSPGCAR